MNNANVYLKVILKSFYLKIQNIYHKVKKLFFICIHFAKKFKA